MRAATMKFSLRSLFLLVLVASLLSLLVRNWIANRPVRFQNYSSQLLKENLDAGRSVMVSIGADWSVNGTISKDMISGKMGYPLRENRIVTLEADWTRPSAEVRALMQGLGIQTVPAIAIFNPVARENPIVMTDLVDQERILLAMEQSTRQSDRAKE